MSFTAKPQPAPHSGYKVCNDNGGQITDEAAAEISANIARSIPFDVKPMDFEGAWRRAWSFWTPEEVLDKFIEAIKRVSIPGFKAADGCKAVYTRRSTAQVWVLSRVSSGDWRQ